MHLYLGFVCVCACVYIDTFVLCDQFVIININITIHVSIFLFYWAINFFFEKMIY